MRLFLDTSVLISASRGRNDSALRLFFRSKAELVTNEYAIKEFRRVMLSNFGLPHGNVEEAILRIRNRCLVLPSPPAEKYHEIAIRDKSDIPIVLGALQAGCILVIDDEITCRDAKKYLKTLKSEEVPL
ncbi:MAG: PIN domain-containing protein [Candidatus Micrarchaeota archaeon]